MTAHPQALGISDPTVQRQECAWCGLELRPGIEPTSHGICDSCAKDFLTEAGLS